MTMPPAAVDNRRPSVVVKTGPVTVLQPTLGPDYDVIVPVGSLGRASAGPGGTRPDPTQT